MKLSLAADTGVSARFPDSSLQVLGLQRQPFEDDGFVFEDQSVSAPFYLTLHLVQSGDCVVLVRGTHGLGKTTLLRWLARCETPDLRWGLVRAQAEMNTRMLAQAMLAALGLRQATSPHSLSAADVVADLAQLSRQGSRPVLLLDQADVLSDGVLRQLLELRAQVQRVGGDLGLVMTAAAGAGRLQDILEQKISPQSVQSVALAAFTELQTAAYLTERFQRAGGPDTPPPDPAAVRDIHRRSGGIPSLIHEAAVQSLGQPPRVAPGVRRLAYVALGAAGVVAVTALILLRVSSPPETPGLAQAPPEAEAPPASTALPPPGRLKLGGQEDSVRTLRGGPDRPLASEISLPGFTPPVPPEVASLGNTTESREAAGDDGSGVAPGQAEQTADTPTVMAEPETEPLEAAPADAEPTPDAERAPAAPADGAQDWLASRPADHYTLQVIAATDEAAVRRFVARHGLEERAVVVETRRQGSPWYVALLGDFPSRDAASSAVAGLPQPVRSNGPWARSFASLR